MMLGWILAGARLLGATGGALPALQEKPWEGYFVACEERGYHFGIGCDGRGDLVPLNRRGAPIGMSKAIRVLFSVEELLPSGRVVAKQIQPDSLQTQNEATLDPEVVKFTGKVTGDASFEASAEFVDGRVRLGGRVLDQGEIKNPLRFAIRVVVREVYKGADLSERDFQRRVKDDEMRIETVDGGREKIEMIRELDVEPLCGKGVSSLRIEMDGYDGRRFEFDASEGSAMWVENSGEKPLVEGFTIHWRPDPAKDPEGGSRLSFEIR